MSDQSPDTTERFAAEVSRLLSERGWSAADLAERSGLDLDEVETILRGEDDVELDAIILLARAFGVSPGDLVDGKADTGEGG